MIFEKSRPFDSTAVCQIKFNSGDIHNFSMHCLVFLPILRFLKSDFEFHFAHYISVSYFGNCFWRKWTESFSFASLEVKRLVNSFYSLVLGRQKKKNSYEIFVHHVPIFISYANMNILRSVWTLTYYTTMVRQDKRRIWSYVRKLPTFIHYLHIFYTCISLLLRYWVMLV